MECSGPGCPVVLLEVQMHPDSGFHHRLAAQTYRFLQRHKLGPAQLPRHLRVFLAEVH